MSLSRNDVAVCVASTAASALCAYLGYRIVGWIGVAVFGLLMTLVAVQVEMDSVAPIGSAQNTGLFSATLSARSGESRAERAARRAETHARARVLRMVKVLGLLSALAGGLGFVMVQLPR